MRTFFNYFLLLALIVAMSSWKKEKPLVQGNNEYQIKAVLIEKFTRFVEWPDGSVGGDPNVFYIKVLGNTPLYQVLSGIYDKVPVKDKKVHLQLIQHPKEIGECHLLFISETSPGKLAGILAYLQKRTVLTVSDTEGFGDYGVMLNFYRNENKIHFEINVSSLKHTSLKVDFRLLEAGKIIKDKNK